MGMDERRELAHWYLNSFDLSKELTQEQIRDFRARGRVRRFGSGEVIHFVGDLAASVCLVLSGLVELARPHEEGGELVISLIQSGEVFGVLALLGRFSEPDMARARIASEVCFLAPDEFRRLLQARPHLAFTVIKSLKGKSVTLENRIEALAFKSLPARVAHTLLQFARAFGKKVDHGVRFTISLTQQNLADLVGASRQHVNYVLTDFRSHRLISGRGRTLMLTDLEGLERIALAP
jgi:CRP/FNR family cyclic AMP-dependent transcriptional regulator